MEHTINPNRTFVQNLFHEALERARDEGVQSENEFRDLVGEIVDEKQRAGVFTKHDNLAQIEQDLIRRWPEAKEALFR